jgi:hypothetical protein
MAWFIMKKIFASFDLEGIFVYQAFNPEIAEEALRLGTFGKGFNLARMTWIKPSFGWMLYRSGYGTKHRQERILKIKLSHLGFQAILFQGVPTVFDRNLFATELDWQKALDQGDVRYQWDPDRNLRLHKLERRAIQLGIRGKTVQNYVHQWIVGIEDVTALAQQIQSAIAHEMSELPLVPEERVYEVSPEIAKILGLI